jgi:hypothetical protein
MRVDFSFMGVGLSLVYGNRVIALYILAALTKPLTLEEKSPKKEEKPSSFL